MEFHIAERVALLTILPPDWASLDAFRVVQDFLYELGFTEQETKDWNIKRTEDRMTWDATKVKPKEVAVGDLLATTVTKRVEELSGDERVTPILFTIYNRLQERGKDGEDDEAGEGPRS